MLNAALRPPIYRTPDMSKSIARKWVGPFKVQALLTACIDESLPRPPESGSAYFISERSWKIKPTPACGPLYVGGNTGRSARFRTRVGDLLADSFGFFGGGTGRSSGGRSLHGWCRESRTNPLRLYLAWVKECDCPRCLEVELAKELKPALNKAAPSKCTKHG